VSGEWRYVLIFSDSHQDPGNAVLNVLQFLDVLASDPIVKSELQ